MTKFKNQATMKSEDKVQPTSFIKKMKKKKKKSEKSQLLNTSKLIQSSSNLKISNDIDNFSELIANYKPRSTPHVQMGKDWTSNVEKEGEDAGKPIPLIVRKQLHELADKIYSDDLKLHLQKSKTKHSGFDQTMRQNVIAHGTTKDKMAAYVLQCMDTPLYSLKHLNSLIDMVSPKLKSYCINAIDHLLKLFKDTFLQKGFVAKEFECHNFKELIPNLKNSPEKVQKILVLWCFEDQIRLAFLKFADNLETVSHDIQEKTKLQGVKGIQNLVKNHFNQDTEIILKKLVNKLGDSNSKIAGDTKNSLSNLSTHHPQLKVTLVSMVEELLYRTNVNQRTQYYCLCFLEDIIFDKSNHDLPERLCKLYFDFFKFCTIKEEINDRFMSAILRGINRAFSFMKNENISFLEKQIDAFYAVSRKTKFNIATQALQLIYKISGSLSDETSDRFYNILYEKMLDDDFGKGSSVSAFLNLVFKSMCKDSNKRRFCAFVRRLLQVSQHKQSEIGCGVLFLVSEALKDNTSIYKISDIGECIFSPTIQEDHSSSCQTLPSSTKMKGKFNLNTKKSQKLAMGKNSLYQQRSLIKEEVDKEFVKTSKYIIDSKNPAYCGADLAPIWELSKVARNYHPSVALFASNLLNETDIKYSGDPLLDFTLFKSLDRFARKNPKKRPPVNKHSEILGSRSYYIPKGARNIPVESEQFRRLAAKNVPAEDMFFYNYFTLYRKEKVKKPEEDDDSSVDDDEFEDYLKRINEAKNFGIEDEDDEIDFDFAKQVEDISVNTGNSDNSDADEDEMDDDEDMDDEDSILGDENENTVDQLEEGSELDYDLDDDEDLDENNDIEDISFSEGSDDEELNTTFKKKTTKKSKRDDDYGDLLVDADEFSHLLEQAANADTFAGTSEAILNKDKSDSRQLHWENKRGRETSNNMGVKSKVVSRSRKSFGKKKSSKKIKSNKGRK